MSDQIAVIGGGASGLFAAGTAAKNGKNVTIIEKNDKTGKKLGITGKGRCNVTNNSPVSVIMDNIPTNPKFMYSSLNAFNATDTMKFFESQGVRLKTERGFRVFPESDQAIEIVDALRKFCHKYGVKIIQGTAKHISAANGLVSGVYTDKGFMPAERVILATGGLSYPTTGSTGDGYRMAKELGHTITEITPSLVPLEINGDFCKKMQGFCPKNVSISIFNSSGEKIYEDFGEMIFTQFGVSGPIILSASAHMKNFSKEKYSLKIDLKPALTEKQLDNRILRDFSKFSNREFSNSLNELAGRSMIPVIVEMSGIPPEQRVNSITKEQRKKLVDLFKGFPLEVSRPRPIEEAVVTSGGIDTREINPKTMESKIVKGLYFAGEIIDVDAYTGGFNLQIAWSTAYSAGVNAALKGD